MIDAPIEFRPTPAPVLPAVTMIVLPGILGVMIPLDGALAPWIRVAVPLGAAIVIAGVVWLWRRRTRTRIVVDRAGITRYTMLGVQAIAWDDIASYRYLSVKQPIVAQGRGGGGLLGMIGGVVAERNAQRANQGAYFGLGYLDLYRRDGSRGFRIAKHPFFGPRAGYDDITELIELLIHELQQRLATDDFAPFTLGRHALLRGDGGEIAFAEIAAVDLSAGKLRILHGEPPAAWATVAMQDVHNSLLLVHRLVQRGVKISRDAHVYVPPRVLFRD